MPKKKKTAKPIRVPRSHSTDYRKAIQREILMPAVDTAIATIRKAGRSYDAIKESMAHVAIDPGLVGLSTIHASAFIERLDNYHNRRFKRVMRYAFGVRDLPFAPRSQFAGILEQAINRNVDLIVTIPRRYHDELKAALSKIATNNPFDEQLVTQATREAFNQSAFNIRRISRDQTSKLIGQLDQAKQVSLGISEYVWATSTDRRVRQTHQANEGHKFSWEIPPAVTGHPKEDIMCRCDAIALIP